jgi:hypothetical protein
MWYIECGSMYTQGYHLIFHNIFLYMDTINDMPNKFLGKNIFKLWTVDFSYHSNNTILITMRNEL